MDIGTIDEIEEIKEIEKNSVIIKITQEKLDSRGGDIYEATRKSWGMNFYRVRNIEYVISVLDNVVQAVYSDLEWSKEAEHPRLVMFEGQPAPQEIQNKYVGKRIPNKFSVETKDSPFLYVHYGYSNATECSKANFLSEAYITAEKYDDMLALLDRKKNIILQGAPGVGKSFLAKRLAYSIIGKKDKNRVEMVQFHQSYSYEDFIEGFRPNPDISGSFEIRQGVFYRFCDKAKSDTDNKYFFIIDEINRGNLSKIMGELMLLLESDKRGAEFAMPLTYSGERFYVPENVYIIGMMNTADRSLAMIDYALRRRFSFIEIEPAFDNEKFIEKFRENYLDADKVIEKMKELNSIISEELDDGHRIGHSYFCSDNPLQKEDISNIFKYEIKELLREYFFDNAEKRREVLELLEEL
ncbi:MAG: AAA family ATPase [Defluviitaleaceae bacterium]|nr:AAA family ATPase [Defluviitaleaceae bacterium]